MKVKNLVIILLGLILINCSKDDNPKQEALILSSENKIISFKIKVKEAEFNGVIDQSNKTILVTVNNIDLSKPIFPIIEISAKATISPSASTAQIFNQDLQYTVTAENGDKAVYNVTVNSSHNEITFFSITPNEMPFFGVINEDDKTITIETIGLEVNSTLIPTIIYSEGATILPDPSTAQDFSKEVKYTLKAQNGDEVVYTVVTHNIPLTNDKRILSFNFQFGNKIYEGIIDHKNLAVYIETDRYIGNIKPIITIPEHASISPNPNKAQNFYQDVEYTVTASDKTSNTYIVTAKAFEIKNIRPIRFYSNGEGVVDGGGLDLTVPNASLVLENNTQSYTLNVSKSVVTVQPGGFVQTVHEFSFPKGVTTAMDYKVKYKINGETKVSSHYVDVVAEDVPVIHSSNQATYKFRDTLILYGKNLVPGLLIYAVKGNSYRLDENYISVNPEGTELTLLLQNYMMFPRYYGISEDYPTRLTIDYKGRRGDSYTVDFD